MVFGTKNYFTIMLFKIIIFINVYNVFIVIVCFEWRKSS